jgi:hypothetical protein
MSQTEYIDLLLIACLVLLPVLAALWAKRK